MTVKVMGRHIGFRADQPGVLEKLLERDLLPPGWEPSDEVKVRRIYSVKVGGEGSRPGVRRFTMAYMNASRLERSMDLDYILDRVAADTQLYVAERAKYRIFVHAGVVAWKGRAIVLPGRSHSGKTTLVAELLRLGATYYSDEYAALTRTGRVHPFPTALNVRRRAKDPNPVRRQAAEFGAPTGETSIPVGLVAFTQYKPGATWRPRTLSRGHGIISLLENTVPARRRPRASLATLRAAVSSASIVRGTRGEAADVAAELLRRLERGA